MRLKHVATINARKLPETTDPAFTFRYIDVSAVDGNGQIADAENLVNFGSAPSRARRLASDGDTIISTVRTYLRAVARVPTSREPLVFSTGFAVLSPGPDIDSAYLYYLCRSEPFLAETVARSNGVSYPAINPDDLADITVDPPSLEEQCHIADFLDAETARVDALERDRRSQLSLLAQREYSMISDVLMSQTSHDAPRVRLGYVCRLQSGLTIDGGRPLGASIVTRPYLRVANVQSGHLDLTEVKEVAVPASIAARCSLRPGDVLMTEGGDLDKLGRGTVWHGELPDCLHQNHVFSVRPEPDRLDAEYLALLTRSAHGRTYFESTGTKTTNLASTSSSKILDFRVPLPKIDEQKALVKHVNMSLENSKRIQSSIERQLTLLAERKQALITAAVTGQIDVTTAREVRV